MELLLFLVVVRVVTITVSHKRTPLTVAGALGTAILLGLLSDSLDLPGVAKRNDGQNGWSKAYRFVACVRYDFDICEIHLRYPFSLD